jgi:hypothetical protein
MFLSVNSICSVLSTVLLILDIGIGVFLFIYLIFGFVKGFKKSLLSFLALVIPVIVLLLILDSVAGKILSINLSGIISKLHISMSGSTVKEVITNLVSSKLYEGDATLASSSRIMTLCEGISVFSIRVFVYSIGISLIFFIIYPINKLIFHIIFVHGPKKDKDGNPIHPDLQSRIPGMVLGFLKSFVLLLLFVFPIYGFVSLGSDIIGTVGETLAVNKAETESDVISSQTIFTTHLAMSKLDAQEDNSATVLGMSLSDLMEIKETIDGSFLEKNILSKTKDKETGLSIDVRLIQSFANVETQDGKLNIIKEYGLMKPVIPVCYQMISQFQSEDGFVFDENTLSLENIDLLEKYLTSSTAINSIVPTVIEYLNYYLSKTQGENLSIDLSQMEDIVWKDEIVNFAKCICDVLRACVTLNLDVKNTQEVLKSTALPNLIATCTKSMAKSKLIMNYLVPLALSYVKEKVPTGENYQALVDMITVDLIKNLLDNDVDNLVEVVQLIVKYTSIQSSETEKIDWASEEFSKDISTVITDFFDMSVVKQNEKAWIEAILTCVDLTEYIDYEKLFVNLDEMNWETEKNALIKTAQDFVVLLPEGEINYQELLQKEGIIQVAEDIGASPFLHKLLNSSIERLLQRADSSLPDDARGILTDLSLEAFYNLTDDEFKAEIKQTAKVAQTAAKDYSIYQSESEKIDWQSTEIQTDIETILSFALGHSLVRGNETKLIEVAISKMENTDWVNKGFFLDEVEKINWVEEKQGFIRMVQKAVVLLPEGAKLDKLDVLSLLNQTEKVDALEEEMVQSSLAQAYLQTSLVNLVDSLEGKVPDSIYQILKKLNLDEIRNLSKDAYQQEIRNLFDLVQIALPVFNSEFKLEGNEALLEEVLTKLFALQLVKGVEADLFNECFAQVGINLTFTQTELSGIDISSEATTIAQTGYDVYLLVKDSEFNLETLIKDKYSSLEAIITESSNSQTMILLVKKLFTSYGKEAVQNTDLVDVIRFDSLQNITSASFKNDMLQMLSLLKDVSEFGLLEGNFVLPAAEKLGSFVENMLTSVVVKGNEEKAIAYAFDKAQLTSLLQNWDITLDYHQVTSWSTEAHTLNQLLVAFGTMSDNTYDFTKVFTNLVHGEKVDSLKDLLSNMDQSQILSKELFTILEKGFKNEDSSCSIDIHFSEDEKTKVRANGWDKEAQAITDVITSAQVILENGTDLDQINENQIVGLMKKAGKGYIASKLMDNILHQVLGEKYVLDLSTPEQMSSDANQTLVKNLIIAGKKIALASANKLDLADSSATDGLISSLKYLGSQEETVVRPLLEEQLGSYIDYEDITEGATLVETVLETYQQSTHQDSFSESDIDSETLSSLSQNAFARTILDLLGIYEN